MPDGGASASSSTSLIVDLSTIALQLSMNCGSDQRVVQLVDVEVEVDAGELEQVEEEERHVGVGEGGVVGHRAGAADARVELAEVHLVVVLVDEDVDVEVAAVALFEQLVAELLGVGRAPWPRTSSENASGYSSLPAQPPR